MKRSAALLQAYRPVPDTKRTHFIIPRCDGDKKAAPCEKNQTRTQHPVRLCVRTKWKNCAVNDINDNRNVVQPCGRSREHGIMENVCICLPGHFGVCVRVCWEERKWNARISVRKKNNRKIFLHILILIRSSINQAICSFASFAIVPVAFHLHLAASINLSLTHTHSRLSPCTAKFIFIPPLEAEIFCSK